jgi:hypothetical protein
VNLPSDLPAIGDEGGDAQEKEAKWEERATILAQGNPIATQKELPTEELRAMQLGNTGRPRSPSSSGRISDVSGDVWIISSHRVSKALTVEKGKYPGSSTAA